MRNRITSILVWLIIKTPLPRLLEGMVLILDIISATSGFENRWTVVAALFICALPSLLPSYLRRKIRHIELRE
jgi:hypothetical protein